MIDLSTIFCGVKFRTPLVLAAGVLGITAASWRDVVKNGAAGITTKSLWLNEHKGHKNPVIIANEHYMLNAVGVPDAGILKAREELGKFLKWRSAPLIANVIAGRVRDFGETAVEIAKIGPQILEINISCPNVESESGRPFACIPADAAGVTREVKTCLKKARIKIPVVIKLSPNVPNIVDIAKAVVAAGADGLTVMNSLGPGMAINIEMKTPVLSNKAGGLTGPALKPIAVKYIYDIHKALPKTPIIGTGGVMTGADAIEMIMAGATLIGIGTGVYYRGIEIFKKVEKEIAAWCKNNRVKHIKNIIGAVHHAK